MAAAGRGRLATHQQYLGNTAESELGRQLSLEAIQRPEEPRSHLPTKEVVPQHVSVRGLETCRAVDRVRLDTHRFHQGEMAKAG